MEADPDKEDIGDVTLDDEKACRWRVVFEGNERGIEEKK